MAQGARPVPGAGADASRTLAAHLSARLLQYPAALRGSDDGSAHVRGHGSLFAEHAASALRANLSGHTLDSGAHPHLADGWPVVLQSARLAAGVRARVRARAGGWRRRLRAPPYRHHPMAVAADRAHQRADRLVWLVARSHRDPAAATLLRLRQNLRDADTPGAIPGAGRDCHRGLSG